MTPPAARTTRRTALVVGLALLGGCAVDGDPAAAPSTPSATPSATPRAPLSSATAPALPAPAPWQPGPGEVRPEVKVAAARHLEAMPPAALAVPGVDAQVLRVVYPQYGGLERRSASVMTVLEQSWLQDGVVRTRRVSVDVRLVRSSDGWSVSEVRVPAELSADVVGLGGDVAALVAHPGVTLPGTAVADLAAGRVDAAVVTTLLGLADRYAIDVSVLGSAHPVEVFGTDRTSNHTRGRAVDVWAVDGRTVASMPLDDPLLRAFLTDARALGSDEVGGPVDLDGAGGEFFADDLHRDHVHVGFDP